MFLIINLSSASITEWIRNVLGNITGFTYWASYGCRFNWYIPAIIVFYLLTPIFFEILKQYDLKGLTALLVLQFIAGFCFAYNTDLLIAVSRFPIYTIGLLAGIRLNINNSLVQKNKDTVKECLYALGCGITGIILLGVMHKYQRIISVDFYNVFWPNILISFAIMYFSCRLFDLIERTKLGIIIVNGMSNIGKISLDLYLIHIVFFGKVGELLEGTYDISNPKAFSAKNALCWILIFIVTIIISYLYNWIINKVEKAIDNGIHYKG